MDQQKRELTERAAKAGFSLVEIIIAISIVGIMAAVAVPNLTAYLKRAKVNATRAMIKAATDATDMYREEHKSKLPASQDAWVEALTGGDEPYIKGGVDALTDPWGNPLRFEKKGKNRYSIASNGPDGDPNTDDDITD